MKKKYSNYFYKCMILALATAICSYITFTMKEPSGTLSAILIVITFLFWFAGVMAPDHEKYKPHDK